jgi:hypothetical protein
MSKPKKSPTSKLAPRHPLVLTADQAETLTEIATLVSYSDGFTYTKPMMALNKLIAALAGPAARRDCLRRAGAREAIR